MARKNGLQNERRNDRDFNRCFDDGDRWGSPKRKKSPRRVGRRYAIRASIEEWDHD